MAANTTLNKRRFSNQKAAKNSLKSGDNSIAVASLPVKKRRKSRKPVVKKRQITITQPLFTLLHFPWHLTIFLITALIIGSYGC